MPGPPLGLCPATAEVTTHHANRPATGAHRRAVADQLGLRCNRRGGGVQRGLGCAVAWVGVGRSQGLAPTCGVGALAGGVLESTGLALLVAVSGSPKLLSAGLGAAGRTAVLLAPVAVGAEGEYDPTAYAARQPVRLCHRLEPLGSGGATSLLRPSRCPHPRCIVAKPEPCQRRIDDARPQACRAR